MNLPNSKAFLAGFVLAIVVGASIALGSREFAHFDPALTGYAIGSLLAAFAVGYRFTVWAQRPPSRLYFKRGLQLLFQRAGNAAPAESSAVELTNVSDQVTDPIPLLHEPAGRTVRLACPSVEVHLDRRDALSCEVHGLNAGHESRLLNPTILPRGAGTLGRALTTGFVAQTFIFRRSFYRWIMHFCLSGGRTLAFAITFPLVFGSLHFESFADNAEIYRVLVFGWAVDSFNVRSVKAAVMFNALNISAVIVLIGLLMAGIRRATDAGERATQTFFEDILPLLLIFAVTATGLALTVSYKYLAGRGHGLWAVVHMITVVALLLFIPFGKLFHIFQRSCALCVARYPTVGAAGPRAHCRCCDGDYASQMHVDDLKSVLEELGFNYRFATSSGELHYQDVCPTCRRRLLALNQGRSLGR